MLARCGFAVLVVSMAAVVYRYDLMAVVRSARSSAVKVREQDNLQTIPTDQRAGRSVHKQGLTPAPGGNKGDEGLGKGSFTSATSIAERDQLKSTLQYYELKSMKTNSDEDQHTMNPCVTFITGTANNDALPPAGVIAAVDQRMARGEDCCSWLCNGNSGDQRTYDFIYSHCQASGKCGGGGADFGGGFGGVQMQPSSGGSGSSSSSSSGGDPCAGMFEGRAEPGILPTNARAMTRPEAQFVQKVERGQVDATHPCYVKYLKKFQGGGYTQSKSHSGQGSL